MTAFATWQDLQDRLDWTLSTAEQGVATSALDDLSVEAAYYGRDWHPETAPRMVKTIVLRAAVRYMKNPDGFVQSRAGDETVAWSDHNDDEVPRATAALNSKEIAVLKELSGRRTGITSVSTFAQGTHYLRHPRPVSARRNDACYVPAPLGSFPLFSDPTEPW